LHELCTNAAKYGGFSTAGGRVSVEWLLVVEGSDRRLRLTWRETGGPAVELPKRRGFGSRLTQQGLSRELNGEVRLDYDPGGVVCTVDVPIPAEDEMPTPTLSLGEDGEQPARAAQ
jgi:two-component system CheB/CheR fusion protein